MTMPKEIVFARHGQSEANIVQKRDDHGLDPEVARAIFDRPDWMNRLTDLGIEQAKQSKIVIDRLLGGLASFDALYVSPTLRTRETAAYMGGLDLGGWTIDDRLVERNWGIYGKRTRARQREEFRLTTEEKERNPWFAGLDGGESMQDVYGRFRDFQATLHREQALKRVFVVAHGDFNMAAMYGIERLLPEEWIDIDRDPAFRLGNCMMIDWAMTNPDDPEDVRDKLRWRRFINPLDPTDAPYGGEWVELRARRRYFGSELLRQVERTPRILDVDAIQQDSSRVLAGTGTALEA